jgi:SAM-dependent methyltransferase
MTRRTAPAKTAIMRIRESASAHDASVYAGRRILEAMRSAPRYADAIYALVRDAQGSVDGRILDFGAGDGVFVQRFLADGIAVDCVEPDSDNRTALQGIGATVAADIGELGNERFAFVYTINVLEHLHDLDHCLGEIHRVLRPNGRFFIFVPAFELLWTSLDDEVAHVRRFTRKSLRQSITAAGFAIDRTRYFDSAGFPAALTVRLIEKIGLFRYSPRTVGLYDKAILPLSLLGDRVLSGILGKNVIAVARKV